MPEYAVTVKNGGGHQITDVEYSPEICKIIEKQYPNDIIICADAFQYLEQHLDDYDFIWASPPCPTHSRLNTMQFKNTGRPPHLPDLRLYSIIIYLQSWHKGKFCVENVIPYYEPLIKPSIQLERHCFWTNYAIPKKDFPRISDKDHSSISVNEYCQIYHIDKTILENVDKRTVLRNMVNPDVAEYILNCALNTKKPLDNFFKPK